MFVDDSTVYMSSSSVKELNVLLQNEIALIAVWVAKNNLRLNVSKTKCIVFESNFALRQDIKLSVSINGSCIGQVNEVKLLGVNLDSKLSRWQKQIKLLEKWEEIYR